MEKTKVKDSHRFRIIIQARMSSNRMPGKMLAPFLGRPLILSVIERLKQVDPKIPVIVGTSNEISDDPLALYVESLGTPVFRGSRENVFGRFAETVKEYPCEAFFRVCGDSPLLDISLFKEAIYLYDNIDGLDLVTNVFPRTFPSGMSVELLNTKMFLNTESHITDPIDKEHVTPYFYKNHKLFKIENIECENASDPTLRYSINDLEDLRFIEKICTSNGIWNCNKKRSSKSIS